MLYLVRLLKLPFSFNDLVSYYILIKVCKVLLDGTIKECPGLGLIAVEMWCCQIVRFRVRDQVVTNIIPLD